MTAQLAPHTLTDAALAALGAGRPSPATLARLRRAQFSRHLLLLRAIAAADPGAVDAYRELAAAERADPAGVRRLLARPLVGLWAADCLTRLRAGATGAGVAGLSALAARARQPIAAPPASTPPATAGAADPCHPKAPNPTHSGRLLRATHDGLTLSVRLEDTDPARSLLGLAPTPPLRDGAVAHWQDCLHDAWRLLVTRHRAAAEVLTEVLDCIVPVEPDPTARGISATSAHAYGAVAMSAPPDPAALAVGLVHEVQHSVLNAVRYLFELHAGPDTPGYSPWRDDPRPASGLLHGAYAYLAVTRFWRGEPGRLARFEFARWRAAVADAADHLLTSGGLTAAGTRFVTALRAEVTPWLTEPVPADVARLAAGANTDHRVRWRLRNLAVEPAAAEALADAWRRGQPPAAVPGARPRPAPGRALENSARLDLAHRLCRAPAPTDSDRHAAATAGDLAYVRGDGAAARRAFAAAVQSDPADDAAWSGLALVSGPTALRDRPEAVAAVFRALGAPATDPVMLATWMFS
ncbi:HEXXH motif-containing protein [Krasilnikovia cinnamomea]|uniref:HEXXH motif-containing protein n=1 Tax=Krasilnikovia cinnamomea TaxID=349313 RepID=A0A4Q7ZNK3_9ACTN|nr:HEXXH motif-containing putative peptide modification protein [Krasilnikovia cinnamomea]RZU52254.1 HEXXH motif-containing protein [Krasilnikovia cinnamomea]